MVLIGAEISKWGYAHRWGGLKDRAPTGTASSCAKSAHSVFRETQSVRPWDLAAQLAGLHPKEIHTQTTRERSNDVHSSLLVMEPSHIPSRMEEGTKEIGRKHTGRAGQLLGRQAGYTRRSIDGS